MPAPSDNVWMPSQGPHPVNIGSSLSKALKARKGTAAPAKRSNLPDREFYSFRYNFKPESIDPTKPGTIEVKKGKESTSVTVERASTQQGEGQLFQGNEQSAKEWECVLIYDEETDTFTLEKLESYLVLNYDRKTVMQSNRPSESPVPNASGSASPIKRSPPVDSDRSTRAPSVQAVRQEEEEASEPETKPPPKPKAAPQPSRPSASSTPAPRPTPKPINRLSLPQKPPTPVEAPVPSPVMPKQVKPTEKAKGKAVKRDRDEMEDKVVQKPPRPTKVSRPSPPPPAPAPAPAPPQIPPQGLALPTAAPAPPRPVFELPFGGGAPSLPTAPPKLVSPPPPPPHKLPTLTVISDSEDEWDEVTTEPTAPTAIVVKLATDEPIKTVQPDESDEEDFDMNAFAQEMDEHLGGAEEEEEDFLAAAVSPEPDPDSEPLAPATGGPMSISQYVGGDIFGDDDYSSSSDESD